MSMDLMVKAMKIKVGSPLRKLVLLKLADNANDQGECWPSYKHLAEQCEIDRSTVRKHIKDLATQGLLRIENRAGPKGNSSNLYFLTLGHVGQNSTPVGPESTPVGLQPTGGVGPESTRTSHSYEPVNEPKDIGADAPEQTGKQKAKASSRTAKFDPLTAKPANVSDQAWKGFVEMRRTKRKELTERACHLIAKKLDGRADADELVDRSTTNSWSDVYTDSKPANGGKPSSYTNLPTHTPEMYQEVADGPNF